MKYAFVTAIVTVLGFVSSASASYVSMTNKCPFPVFYSQAWHVGEVGDIMIEPNGGTGFVEMNEPAGREANGTSLKFHKGDGLREGILQFEYAKEYDNVKKTPGIWWDFSHVDGDKPGVPGCSPFADVDVMAIPLGAGRGYGSCDDVFCAAGEVCVGSYPYDKDHLKTKHCPLEMESFEIEFCVADE